MVLASGSQRYQRSGKSMCCSMMSLKQEVSYPQLLNIVSYTTRLLLHVVLALDFFEIAPIRGVAATCSISHLLTESTSEFLPSSAHSLDRKVIRFCVHLSNDMGIRNGAQVIEFVRERDQSQGSVAKSPSEIDGISNEVGACSHKRQESRRLLRLRDALPWLAVMEYENLRRMSRNRALA